ncbi:universal stress protein [Actinoplanes sp. NPDC026670]|uniref:universal stress protein n=1 Tax=Actinoplanes sp. NPDC026670 TaxID=3154700 RepID=UPI003408FC88
MTAVLCARTPAITAAGQRPGPAATALSRAVMTGEVLSFSAVEARGASGSVVVAAVDDDGNPDAVISFAADCARELAVALRVTYVWSSEQDPGRNGVGRRMLDADLMLSSLLYGRDGGATVERALLHDADPAAALVALSRTAALMVVAASSGPRTATRPLGDTVRALAGRTHCPLLVVAAGQPTDPTAARW